MHQVLQMVSTDIGMLYMIITLLVTLCPDLSVLSLECNKVSCSTCCGCQVNQVMSYLVNWRSIKLLGEWHWLKKIVVEFVASLYFTLLIMRKTCEDQQTLI